MINIKGMDDGRFMLRFSLPRGGACRTYALRVVAYSVSDIHEAIDHWHGTGTRVEVHQANAGGDCPLCAEGRRKEESRGNVA